MKNKLIPALTLLFLMFGLLACNHQIVPGASTEATLPKEGSNVIIAQNHFAFRLFQETALQEKNDANKLISPLSVYLDLSMAYNGAADSTLEAMRQTLGLNDIPTDVLNKTNELLINSIPQADKNVKMTIANSIWYRQSGTQPLSDFVAINSKYYNAAVTGANFSPETVNQINHWVAEKTNQKIKSIVQRIEPEDVMYLINAVYFKGNWKVPFEPKMTKDRPFTTESGKVAQVPFMQQKAEFNYMQNDTLQMVELPYGKGDFSMYVLLSGKNVSMTQFIAQLNESTLSQYITKMDSVKINLWIPKWKYSYEISDLKPELTALGMHVAFTDQADFSKMYPAQTPMHISKVVHKTYIEVNEQGTEAAGATSIGVSVTSMPLNPPPVMDVNRPFVYLITEKNSGSILFIGKVNNPAE